MLLTPPIGKHLQCSAVKWRVNSKILIRINMLVFVGSAPEEGAEEIDVYNICTYDLLHDGISDR